MEQQTLFMAILNTVFPCMCCKGQTQHAVIIDPTRREEFSASRGKGAELNGERIRVSTRNGLKDLAIGNTSHMNDSQAYNLKILHLQSFIQTQSHHQKVWLLCFRSSLCCSRKIGWILGQWSWNLGCCCRHANCRRSRCINK